MKRLCLTLLSVTLSHLTEAQSIAEAVAGFGYPDLIHVGANIAISPRASLGISLGGLQSESKLMQVTVEHKTNFSQSKTTARPTWYFNERLTYLYEDNETKTWRILYLTPAIGRHLNITDNFGVNVDVGIFFRLWQKQTECPSCGDDDDSDATDFASPTARLQVFYKLKAGKK